MVSNMSWAPRCGLTKFPMAWHWAASQWCCCSWHDLRSYVWIEWSMALSNLRTGATCVVYLHFHIILTQKLRSWEGDNMFVSFSLVLHLILHFPILIQDTTPLKCYYLAFFKWSLARKAYTSYFFCYKGRPWAPIWILKPHLPRVSAQGGTFHQSKAALHEDGLPESAIG